MADLIHRLRRIAAIGGDERRIELERTIRNDGLGGRALMECKDPRAIANALMRISATMRFESLAHAERLVACCRLLADAAGVSEREMIDLELGARVHDIGKLAVSAAILAADEALTATELDWIRMHGSFGHAILAGVPGFDGGRELVLCHHEYFDGSGYPDGKRGAAIPRIARIFTLVDSYEAIVRDDVVYRARRDHATARAELVALAGTRYDPELIAAWSRIDVEHWTAVYEQPRLAA